MNSRSSAIDEYYMGKQKNEFQIGKEKRKRNVEFVSRELHRKGSCLRLVLLRTTDSENKFNCGVHL